MTTICIDGYNLSLPHGTGIATYGGTLAASLRALGFGSEILYGPASAGRDQVLTEAALVGGGREGQRLSRKQKAVRFFDTLTSPMGRTAHRITPSGEVIWRGGAGAMPAADHFRVARNLFAHSSRAFNAYGRTTPVTLEPAQDGSRPAAVHWTTLLPLHARNAANVYTIHDLIPLRLPHTTLDDKAKFLQLCKHVAAKADHIAVVSETTRQDVIRLLNVPEDRITNTYQSLPAYFEETIPAEQVATELEGVFGLGWRGYFLHYGAIEPKKNLGRIVEAYLASGVKTPLVIVGGKGWLQEGETGLLNQIKRDGGANADRIRQYEYLPRSLLSALVRGARATLFPSLYEGFGLPVLESMAQGTPVLTSTEGSLPEVAGDAALLVDPYDSRAIGDAIKALDGDAALRDDLSARGLRRAAFFSQTAYQERLRSMYEKIGIRPG